MKIRNILYFTTVIPSNVSIRDGKKEVTMIELTLSSKEMRGKALQDLTQDLCDTLVREARINAELKKASPAKGEKGDPITMGVLVLAFITSGTAVGLINAISAYFARSKTLEFSFKKPNGDAISIKSENLTPEERERTLQQLQDFLKD